jgi:hydroxymethylpyrimidine pyrophosphatase-like HAD family hydrolase
MGPYRALATDGDGTLTLQGKMPSSLVRALEQLRKAGGRLILVTGEALRSAEDFSHVRLFHRVVAENGAVLLDPASGSHRILTEPRPPELLPALEARTGCVSGGHVAMMCKTRLREDVVTALRELGSDWRTIVNREDLLVLPPGVSKATGLGIALKELGLAADQVVAVGDAENDIPLLECCGVGAAVSNGLPLVKKAAHFVTSGSAGEGVAELIERLLRGDLPLPHVRRHLANALDDGGMEQLAIALQPRSADS